MRAELREQRAPIRGTHGERDPLLRKLIAGKLVHLAVGEHLQAVLQSPQVQIRGPQLRDGRFRHEPQLTERSQRLRSEVVCSRRSRPPRMSWNACTMNSISRMPPGPSLMWPASSRRSTSRSMRAFISRRLSNTP